MLLNSLPILHIGYPKTGTTWFQKKFYPKVKNIKYIGHNEFINILNKDGNKINPDQAKKNISDITERIIVCDENMIGSEKNIKKNALLYKQIFGDAIIVVFIRNQAEKLISNYSEYVKAGGTLKLNDFLFNKDGSIYGGNKHLYHYSIEIYKEIFGEKNVHIYVYENFKKSPEIFMQKFIDTYKLNVRTEAIHFLKVNKKLSKSLLHLKRISNMFTRNQEGWLKGKRQKKYFLHIPFWFTISKKLFVFLNLLTYNSSGKQNYLTISQKNYKTISDFFKNSNQILISKHNVKGLEEYNYPL